MFVVPLDAQRKRGFTLIELLVVISIISMLISILLPALSAARASAQNIACGSNLRQIGIAVAAYQADHDGYFPQGRMSASREDRNALWSSLLWYDGYVSAFELYACPSFNEGATPWLDPSVHRRARLGHDKWLHIHYGANELTVYGQLSGTSSYSFASIRSADVLKPSETASHVDGIYAGPAVSIYVTPAPGNANIPHGSGRIAGGNYVPHTRHQGNTANFMMTDGHVKTVKGPDNWTWNMTNHPAFNWSSDSWWRVRK